MGEVQVLSSDTVSLISAGEVIESPASVVKELIENSLDAQADRITVQIDSGGIDRISVSDNGVGILKDDLPCCLERYSTSKIRDKEDLQSISTYGFRGEALSSIVAVADVRIKTRRAGEDLAYEITASDNDISQVRTTSRPTGTTVTVTDIFQRVPARRKHLDGIRAESRKVTDVVRQHAIIRNDVGFKLVRDNSVVIDCPKDESTIDRVLCVLGSEIAAASTTIDYTENGIEVTGFVAHPPHSRGNRGREYISVRRRPIYSQKLATAIEAAYGTQLMKGRYPICCINIELDPQQVDENVHPNKREVKIWNVAEVLKTVRLAVEIALDKRETATVPTAQDRIKVPQSGQTEIEPSAETAEGSGRQEELVQGAPLLEQVSLQPLGNSTMEPEEVVSGLFRVLGQIHKLYILLEVEEGLLIVDQHAAHERILYEQLREEVDMGPSSVQELLEPIVLNMNKEDIEEIMKRKDALQTLGYSLKRFGDREILVSTIPDVLGNRGSKDELVSLIDRIIDINEKYGTEKFEDALLKVTACHSAIRAGEYLSKKESKELVLELLRTRNRFNCCHGRPSMMLLSKNTLDKAIGRRGPEAILRYMARHGTEPK